MAHRVHERTIRVIERAVLQEVCAKRGNNFEEFRMIGQSGLDGDVREDGGRDIG